MSANEQYLDYAGLERLVSNIDTKIDALSTMIEHLPIGTVVMWSGAEDGVPSNWAICNGQNGTPDLRGRFILGASEEYTTGDTGGDSTHTLTIDEMPAHHHTTAGVNVTAGDTGGSLFSGGEDNMSPADSVETSETGGGEPISIMPPYYVLAFIMKIE